MSKTGKLSATWASSNRAMKSDKNHIGDTIRVLRPPPRVFTNQVGGNVWMGEVEPAELELEDAATSNPYDSAPDSGVWSRTNPG